MNNKLLVAVLAIAQETSRSMGFNSIQECSDFFSKIECEHTWNESAKTYCTNCGVCKEPEKSE